MSPPPADNFPALGDNNVVIPPDTHGAAGPNHLMVMLNSQVRIQDKTGGTISTVSLNAFWASRGGGSGTFDPRIAYDPYGGRWIATACDDARSSTSSGILIGVSQTSDPTGFWNLYKVDSPVLGTVWLDYPSLGFNKDWVTVHVNSFLVADDTFDGSFVFAFDKANLYTAGPVAVHTRFDLLPGDGATLVPAQTYDPALTTQYLMQDGPFFFDQLSIHILTGMVGAETLTLFDGDVITPDVWDIFGPDAPQPGPPPDGIDAGDSRMRNVVYRNGSLWTAQTVFLPLNPAPDRASAQWTQVLPDATLVQFGRVDDPSASTFYAYPSIGVNANNDVLLGYSRFSTTQHPSASYSFRTGNDPLDTLQPDFVFKAGEGGYEKYFAGGRNRWGDYSNTVVDPANDRDLWTIQEYAATPVGVPPNSGRWGTWWALVESSPKISIGDVSQAEGTVFSFNVTLDRQVLQTVTVDFDTANGSALVLDGDYLAASGQVTFLPGQTTQPVTVTVVGDTKFELDEDFFVDLTNPQNADLADAQGQGTILNDDPQPSLSVDDVAIPEGNSGTTAAAFNVTLSNPSSQTVTVTYQTPGVTAMPPGDYILATALLTFNAGVVSQPVSVIVNGDPTAEPDETFNLLLSGPTNATIADAVGLGTILNDDTVDGVEFFTVTSRPGQNILEWVNPQVGPFFGTVIRYNVSTPGTSDCTTPTSTTGTAFPVQVTPLGGRDSLAHGPVPTPLIDNTKYCYAAFVQKDFPGTVFSSGFPNSGRPFPLGGPVKWAINLGAFSMVPPGNDIGMVHAVDQNGSLHSMVKGPLGGTWPLGPPDWMPQRMTQPSQGRPSGIPVVTPGATRTIFLTSQDGRLYAFNAQTGALSWITDQLAPPPPPFGLQAHPSGVFTVFAGSRDLIFVGTREATGSKFYALRLSDGKPLSPGWVFDGGAFGKIGAINGQPVVDQVNKRVYFASREFDGANNKTVWCVDLETGGGIWAEPYGDIDSALTLGGGFLFVGGNDLTVKKINPLAPSVPVWSFTIFPGSEAPAKGYVLVDRFDGNVFFSTATKIWGLNPDGTARWGATGDRTLTIPGPSTPSTPLFAPGDAFVYIGGADGRLHRLFEDSGLEDGGPPFPVMLGDGTGPAGSPTWDLAAGYLYVTATGIVYAVQP